MLSIDDLPSVLKYDEVAGFFRITPAKVAEMVAMGKLEAFDAAGEPRVWKESLLKAMKRSPVASVATTAVTESATAITTTGAKAVPASSFVISEIVPASAFSYRWPQASGKPVFIENYDRGAFTASASTTKGEVLTVKVGITTRESSGKEDRIRVVVFVDGQPTIECVGADDFDHSHLVVSIIKPDGRKHLRVDQTLPPEFAGFDTRPFNQIVTGPNAKTGVGVVCSIDDIVTIVRHALIRWAAKRD